MNYKDARAIVIIRDKYTCQECGSKNNLEVHHIGYRMGGHKPHKMITLCYHCHSLKHPVNRRNYLVSIGFFKDKSRKLNLKRKAEKYEQEALELSRGKNGPCTIEKR